jgi:hypothetical protein
VCSGSNPCPGGQCCSGDGTCGACLVFISSSVSLGNLGGLTGADNTCQTLANTAGLSGTYKAWLSDDTGSPSTRFVQATVPYQLPNGTPIADNWDDLKDGTLAAPINIMENGNPIPNAGSVWTNTNTDGTVQDFRDCNDWMSGTSAHSGNFGLANRTNSEWTVFSRQSCGPPPAGVSGNRLYCFQQT